MLRYTALVIVAFLRLRSLIFAIDTLVRQEWLFLFELHELSYFFIENGERFSTIR